jgi:ferredoxin/flavodoxin---NADP+ reductase
VIISVMPGVGFAGDDMSTAHGEEVVEVRHWTESLFSFVTTRNASFRFRSGEFTMLGLDGPGRPIHRAYSIASAPYEDRLAFFSIKVPDGAFTSRLQHLAVGGRVMIGRKATGTLLIDNLLPGERLYLFGTGTGLAPFLSIIKDPETYERFAQVVLVHGCRKAAELAYGDGILAGLPQDEYIGEAVAKQLIYHPTVTREPFRNEGRVTELLESGRLAAKLGLPDISAGSDRVMLCGGPAMLRDMRALLEARGMVEGNHAEPGHYVLEKAFAER